MDNRKSLSITLEYIYFFQCSEVLSTMCDACLSIAFVYFIFAIFSLKVFVYIINQESIKEHYFLGGVYFLFCFNFPAHLFINNQLPIPVDILNRQYYLIILSYVNGF